MLAVSQTSLEFFGTNRTSSLDIDKKATVTVLQPDLQSSLDVEVNFEDADRGYCNPDRGAYGCLCRIMTRTDAQVAGCLRDCDEESGMEPEQVYSHPFGPWCDDRSRASHVLLQRG